LTIDGTEHKALIHTGKSGWGVVLDRESGEFLTAWNFGTNNYIEGYDEDGEVIYIDEKLPWPAENYLDTDLAITICPDGHGVRAREAPSQFDSTGLHHSAASGASCDITRLTTDYGAREWYFAVHGPPQTNPDKVTGVNYSGATQSDNQATGEND